MYSVPKSTPKTADAASAVELKRKKRHNIVTRGEESILLVVERAMLGGCRLGTLLNE